MDSNQNQESNEIITKNLEYETKFAHDGHTVFVINESANKLLTGGADGEVRSWSIVPKDDDEPESYDVGSAIYSITSSNDNYYVASDSIDVKYYELADGSYKGSVVRSTLNIYSVCLSADHKLLAAGGGDFIIKLVNLDDHSIKQINGHEAPILDLKIDPKNKYLASSSCDGTVRIWNLSNLENVKKFNDNHKKSNDFSNSSTLCSLAWNTEASLLAVPNDNSIQFYERDLWSVKFSLNYENFNSISICEFDKTDKYFAASNSKGVLIIWNLNFKDTPIAIYVNEYPITCFKFNPQDREKLVVSDKNGQLIYVSLKQDNKMVKLDKEMDNKFAMIKDDFDDSLDETFNDADFMKDLDAIDLQINKEKKTKQDEVDEEEEDDFADKKKFTLSKFSTSKKPNKKIIESDEDSNDVDNDCGTQATRDSRQSYLKGIDVTEFDNAFDDDDDDDEMINIGALKQKYENKINGSFNDNVDKINEGDKKDDQATLANNNNLDIEEHKIINIKVKPILQPPFQPGSTPVELENRYMVWNSVGIVSCTRTEQENTIDVEFHNSDINRPIHIPNTYNYTMADLNNDTLILAAPLIESENEDDNTASILFCMNFGSWDTNKEWRYTMPANESIEAIAVSSNFVIVSTDQRQLRLFTLSGIQLHLFSLPGPVICLSAQDIHLAIFYHNGSGLPGEQSVSMNLLKLNDRSFHPLTQLVPTQSQIPVALSPKSIIEWAGFTDEGNACTLDSAGLFRLFNLSTKCWIPVADLKSKNKNDHYFIINVSEIQEQIRCISCRGSKYPSTIPKPDVYSLPFEIPLCEITTTKAKLEEQLIRTSLRKSLLDGLSFSGFDVEFTNEENSKKQIEILIKLFALAVNADCNSLAIEVAGLMPNQLAIEGAIRYASQKNKTFLINKLNRLSKEKFGAENENENTQLRSNTRTANANNKLNNKKRQIEDDNDVLKPKQIKIANNNNPFKI